MTDIPRLRTIDQIPEPLRGKDFAFHIHKVMEFPAEERRILPPEVEARIREEAGNEAFRILEPLAAMQGFLSHTFVFDNLGPAEREAFRDRMEQADPEGHAWYQSHMLRINNLTSLLEDIRKVAPFAEGTMKRAFGSQPVDDRIDALADNINFRWKKVSRYLENMTPHEQQTLQRDILEVHIAPLVQDVFDITVWTFNDKQPIPTTPEGKISRSMFELVEMQEAIKRGMQPPPATPNKPEDDPKPGRG